MSASSITCRYDLVMYTIQDATPGGAFFGVELSLHVYFCEITFNVSLFSSTVHHALFLSMTFNYLLLSMENVSE